MIYLQDTNEDQTIWVPKSFSSSVTSFAMIFHSTTGLENIVTEVTDEGEGDYYKFTVNVQGLALTPGEWEYTVTSFGTVMASGILTVVSDELEYRKIYDKNITYEQYRAE